MKVLAINSARSIWLVTVHFLNPRGRFIIPAVAAVAERYNFAKSPDAREFTVQPLALKFEGGSFADSQGAPIFVNLSAHDDGLVAETRSSTNESDRFLHDVLSWFSSTYELPLYSDFAIEKIYTSELVVQLDLPPSMFSQKFLKFAERLGRGISNNPASPWSLLGFSSVQTR